MEFSELISQTLKNVCNSKRRIKGPRTYEECKKVRKSRKEEFNFNEEFKR